MAMGCNYCVTAFIANDPPEKNPHFANSCGHLFHLECIQKALSNRNHFCPVCRYPVSGIESFTRLHLSSISTGNTSIPDRRLSLDASEDEEMKSIERDLRKIRYDVLIEEDRIKKIYSYIKEISKNVQHINIEMTENVIDLCESILEHNDIQRIGRNSPSFLPRLSVIYDSQQSTSSGASTSRGISKQIKINKSVDQGRK